MAVRMLAGKGGSTVQWTRREMTSDGVAGTVEITSSTTHSVRVAQLSPQARQLFADAGWQSSAVQLAIASKGLPFTSEPHSGFPEVRFEDFVNWLGVEHRVTFFQAWAAPGGKGQPPKPAVYFVGLAA